MRESTHAAFRRLLALGFILSLTLALPGQTWAKAATTPVNVNTADASQLQSLPGIGPSKASAIISYRSANGPFKRVDDLVRVKGIGPKTLAKLRPLVTCGKKGSTGEKTGRSR